jgi:GNAT superfamily N-acetyltransferase
MPSIDRLGPMTLEDRAAILAPLDKFSRGKGFVWSVEPLALALRNDSGAIVGGLIGEMHWGWLRIDILAVEKGLRGQGWGGLLLAEAERMAVEAGCHHAWLDTFSFQARPFYEKAGYRVFGELADYPVGQSRYFLAKTLTLDGDRAPISGVS